MFGFFLLILPKNKPQLHEKICKMYDYFDVKIPKESNKISNYTQGQKSIKILFIIYSDTESLLEKLSSCKINLQHCVQLIGTYRGCN